MPGETCTAWAMYYYRLLHATTGVGENQAQSSTLGKIFLKFPLLFFVRDYFKHPKVVLKTMN